jgi:conjugative relaxase-like TrwC/TraI family protein
MLRIRQNTHVIGAKGYYSSADYYSEGQELTGHWRGEAARMLGLEGEVKQQDWDALCDNVHPQTGERLTARTDEHRTIGYDFNFHVPKSVSLLYAVTRDDRLLDAFREAVDVTMKDMEAEMATRVRKNGRNENRFTGNLAWGEFIHFTSRPVGGVPDPHLHAHCFVFNKTWDDTEHTWKAGQFRELVRDAPYFEAVFHSHLAGRLAEQGLPIERTKKGWELGGLSQQLIDKFSRRTKQIEEKAREKGITSIDAKAELGAKTRERKAKNLTFPQLQETWRSWMTHEELESLKGLEQRTGSDALPPDANASGRAIEFAVGHSFERKSVVPERELLAAALRQSVGEAKVSQVLVAESRNDSIIVAQRGGRRMATTRDVLKEEKSLIEFARKGRGRFKPLGQGDWKPGDDRLNAAQQQAVSHLLRSRDQVMLLRGAAGVGKTTLMKEVVDAIEAGGTKVFAFAPSADASRGVLRADGFKDADTVARFLLDEKLQQQAAGQVIWIDEAGLLGTGTMARVFDLAAKLEARVLLSGDRRQHGSVERGAALRLLEEEAGLVPAEVKDIQRQAAEYKEAVRALSDGNIAEGFSKLDALGWVKEAPDAVRYQQLATDYVETVAKGKKVLVVSPTHAEGNSITKKIRHALQESGLVGPDERTFRRLENASLTEAERSDKVNFRTGDVLQFHQNAKGYQKGQRLEVGKAGTLPLEHAKRFQLFHASTISLAPGDLVRITQNGRTADEKHRLDNGMMFRVRNFDANGDIVFQNGWKVSRDWGHLEYGYVVTSHASQGKTVDRVLVGQSSKSFPASSREQFYVSASRARERVTIYTDDKEALREAIGQTDGRLTATEFVNGAIMRQAETQRQQTEATREPEGKVYERQ